jgi:hypothetical protein
MLSTNYFVPTIQNLPMKNSIQKKSPSSPDFEKQSESLLIEKMGMSKREIQEVYLKYGVTASKLVELMQLSKYQFIYTGKVEGICEPCMVITELQPAA